MKTNLNSPYWMLMVAVASLVVLFISGCKTPWPPEANLDNMIVAYDRGEETPVTQDVYNYTMQMRNDFACDGTPRSRKVCLPNSEPTIISKFDTLQGERLNLTKLIHKENLVVFHRDDIRDLFYGGDKDASKTRPAVQEKPLKEPVKPVATPASPTKTDDGSDWSFPDWFLILFKGLMGVGLIIAVLLILWGLIRRIWNWATQQLPRSSGTITPQNETSVSEHRGVTESRTGVTDTIPGNDTYVISVPSGTRVETQTGNGPGRVHNN